MDLLDIRTWFVRESGRYDLVVDAVNWADNGANAYIQAACRTLDRMQTHPKTMGRNFQDVAIGDFYVPLEECRAIKEVWGIPITDTTSGRWRLEKKSTIWMREEYSNMLDLTNGTPLYYCPAVLRPVPNALTVDQLAVLIGYADILTESVDYYSGVFFMPPTDQAMTIETWGYFYSTLTLDDDTNYWSVYQPELLVMAAQMVVEKFMRNTEGVKDWMAAIQMELQGIDKDLVEEDIADVNQMEG